MGKESGEEQGAGKEWEEWEDSEKWQNKQKERGKEGAATDRPSHVLSEGAGNGAQNSCPRGDHSHSGGG